MQTVIMSVFLGIVGGFCYSFLHFVAGLLNNNKISIICGDLISSLGSGALFIYCVIKYNAGLVNLYIVCGFLLGILVEIVSIGNLLDFFANFIYTRISNVAKRLKVATKKGGKNESRPT